MKILVKDIIKLPEELPDLPYDEQQVSKFEVTDCDLINREVRGFNKAQKLIANTPLEIDVERIRDIIRLKCINSRLEQAQFIAEAIKNKEVIK